MAEMGIKGLPAAAVRKAVLDAVSGDAELALLDVRETGTFGDNHLLHARTLPLSRLELLVDDLVPRKTVPIILCAYDSGDDDLVARAATRLADIGYTDIAYLQGGVVAWGEAGFEVFSGVNVPSKAFGEFVEHTYDTPRMPASDVQAMIDAGENMVVLDSRPMDEYLAMSIPTGIDVPGAELALRVHDLAPDPSTTVVVNCAGRTRSIIGCQSLINAGIPNRVVALENGTMGWHLAGLTLDRGQSRTYDETSAEGQAKADAAAARVRDRFGVASVDWATVTSWLDDGGRTTYLLDVRAPSEYIAGHVAGAKSSPGGQLVQGTDKYVGVLGARLVIIDDNGVRATMTASWLVQMGWHDVHVLGNADAAPQTTGPHAPHIPGLDAAPGADLPPTTLNAMLKADEALVIDLADSIRHRAGHIPGSRFATRANLARHVAGLPGDKTLVLTAADDVLSRMAAADLAAAGITARVLAGGNTAWAADGFPLESGFENNLDPSKDVWYRPYDMDDSDEGAMKQYLSWEIDLVKQIERDGTTNFRSFQ